VKDEVVVGGEVALGIGIGTDVTENATRGRRAKLGFRKYGSDWKRSERESERTHVVGVFSFCILTHITNQLKKPNRINLFYLYYPVMS